MDCLVVQLFLRVAKVEIDNAWDGISSADSNTALIEIDLAINHLYAAAKEINK